MAGDQKYSWFFNQEETISDPEIRCHGKSEILDVGSKKWTNGTDFPISPLRGHMMTADDQFVYVLAGKTIGGGAALIPSAYKYDVSSGIWSEIGSLIQRSSWLNSVTQFNSSWYAGYCALEKATLDENGMIDSEIILPDNNNCYMELYYATFVEIPAGKCQA
ncbi:Oidioi.mRNA.OKI2018_I69.PAR.g9346.t1.cds [Oikopleura dioica]|uniref:Oidioi.mRNA.OKI2018_I69.PAR.g9346.t1.cds n=1 Tax=Oikopleura dioica TaxID=34765 RepID=A0ABN7RK55_OIKDI|nr:Oidioi.mRNA.OKI2018_I69.PAR.g9346.t1.cds [Oikopleura dioica]